MAGNFGTEDEIWVERVKRETGMSEGEKVDQAGPGEPRREAEGSAESLGPRWLRELANGTSARMRDNVILQRETVFDLADRLERAEALAAEGARSEYDLAEALCQLQREREAHEKTRRDMADAHRRLHAEQQAAHELRKWLRAEEERAVKALADKGEVERERDLLRELVKQMEAERCSVPRKWTMLDVAFEAARKFGGNDGLFNTACFQSVIRDRVGICLNSNQIVDKLRSEPRIVWLSGGCHWMILPNQMARCEADLPS